MCSCLVPPIIIQLQPDGHEHVVTEGYTLYLDCVTLGYPQPQISWRTNGRPVDLTKSRFTLFPNGTLRVDRVIEADDGLYTCIATNLVGTARQQSSVDVWSKKKCHCMLLCPVDSNGRFLVSTTVCRDHYATDGPCRRHSASELCCVRQPPAVP